MSEANFLQLFPEQEGYPVPARRRTGRSGCRDRRRHRSGASRSRRRRGADRAAAGGIPRASRTPTCRRSRRSADSGCWSARSGLPRCCCATCSSGAASWRCSARSATAAGTFLPSSLSETGAAAGLGLAIGAACAVVADRCRRCSNAAAGCRRPAPRCWSLRCSRPACYRQSIATRAALRTPLLEALRSE